MVKWQVQLLDTFMHESVPHKKTQNWHYIINICLLCQTLWLEEVNRPRHMWRDICHLPISRKALSIHPSTSVQLIETLYKFDDDQKNSYGVISKRLLCERILWSYIDHSRIVIFTCHFHYSQSLHLYLWNFCSSSLILHI